MVEGNQAFASGILNAKVEHWHSPEADSLLEMHDSGNHDDLG